MMLPAWAQEAAAILRLLRKRKLHNDRVRAFKARHPERSREQVRRAKAKYRATHPDRIAASNRVRTERHAERYAETRAVHHARKLATDPAYSVAAVERVRAWRAANPEKTKAQRSVANGNRRAALAKVPTGTGHDRVTAKAWEMQLEVFGHRCAYCLEPLTPSNTHRDHVTSLARGGAHAMSNIVPACASCNLRKNARGPLAMLKGV